VQQKRKTWSTQSNIDGLKITVTNISRETIYWLQLSHWRNNDNRNKYLAIKKYFLKLKL
jgi:hypothetical protein